MITVLGARRPPASSSRPDILRSQVLQGHRAGFYPARRRLTKSISGKLQEDHIPETGVTGIQTSHNNRWDDGGWPARVAGHPRRARAGCGGRPCHGGRVVPIVGKPPYRTAPVLGNVPSRRRTRMHTTVHPGACSHSRFWPSVGPWVGRPAACAADPGRLRPARSRVERSGCIKREASRLSRAAMARTDCSSDRRLSRAVTLYGPREIAICTKCKSRPGRVAKRSPI